MRPTDPPSRAAADVDYLRGHNEALVMSVARRAPEFDRATVAAATGLTPQAVSKVVGRLAAAGLVEPCGARRGGVGKPATVYRIVPGSRYAIGAHITRRTLRVVATDLLGTVLDTAVAPLPADFTPGDVLDGLSPAVDRVRGTRTPVAGVGIGMVGPLDHARGLVRDSHGLRHWHDVPLGDLAAERLGLPVVLDKDVAAGVTAEAWQRGPEFHDAAFVMVESGIGAGLWLGGRAYRGAHTNASEFGHAVVALDGPRCACGRYGCLEIVHSVAVGEGDVEQAARVLGTGIVNLLQTIDVDRVVLAGADLIGHADTYLSAVRAAIQEQVPRADWLTVEVTLSRLGADAVAVGAAVQVLHAFYGPPGRS